MNITTTEKRFNIIFIILLGLLCIGTPLLFTSLTRSVFEVNKLLLLRIITLLVMAIWFFKYILFKSNGIDHSISDSYNFFGLRWKKTGLEIPALFWVGFNIISTIFSQNIYLSIIGSYDRWEGIITIINYVILIYMFAKLIKTDDNIKIITYAIVIPASLSAIYGIFQSVGIDFMQWSADATKRVFACINNPVHFCAYVAMVVPFCIAWSLKLASDYQTNQSKRTKFLSWFMFLMTCIVYYSQFLSFSRATWMGFIGSLPLLYIVVTEQHQKRSSSYFLWDILFTIIFIGAFNILEVFHIYKKGLFYAAPFTAICIAYFIFTYHNMCYRFNLTAKSISNILLTITITMVTLLLFIFDLTMFSKPITIALYASLSIYFGFLCIRLDAPFKFYLSRLLIIFIFSKLQFVALTIPSIFLYFLMVFGYYKLQLKGNPNLIREKKFWLLGYLIIFAIIIILPMVPHHLKSVNSLIDVKALNVSQISADKVQSYSNDAIKGTARTSMWKSSFPWIKDHWLLGSGPDTIKYMYPTYRRPEYGKLEGGHNFTPDRLHNEYLNTLATRGIPGFLIYYIGLIGVWAFYMFKSIHKHFNNTNYYLIIGVVTGCFIYLGQVLFNFGVVATLVLFYIYMGFGLAISRIMDNTVKETSND